MSERVETHTSTMHERVEHYKKKMQETLDRLKSEETVMASMVKELEAARKDKAVVEEQMRLNRLEQEHDPVQNLKLAAPEEDLRVENEKLKKQMIVLKKRETVDISTDAALKDFALATTTAERYKEVNVTRPNGISTSFSATNNISGNFSECLQYLIYEVASGGPPKKVEGFFGSNDTDVPTGEMRQLEIFFNQISLFPHILDYRATLVCVTDLGFLWFREFYMETSKVIQFPIACSLPGMLLGCGEVSFSRLHEILMAMGFNSPYDNMKLPVSQRLSV